MKFGIRLSPEKGLVGKERKSLDLKRATLQIRSRKQSESNKVECAKSLYNDQNIESYCLWDITLLGLTGSLVGIGTRPTLPYGEITYRRFEKFFENDRQKRKTSEGRNKEMKRRGLFDAPFVQKRKRLLAFE